MTDVIERYADYLRNVRIMKPRSVHDYVTTLQYISEEIDPLKAESRGDVRNALLRLKKKKNWGSTTIGHHSIRIKNFYDWATSERLIPFNPYPFSEFKRPRAKTVDYINEEQYEGLVKDFDLTMEEATCIRLLGETGLRPSEFSALRQKHIIWEKCVIHVDETISKGGYSDRFIPIHLETLALLSIQVQNVKYFYDDTEHLFFNRYGNPIDERQVYEMILRIGERATKKRDSMKICPKMFRHGFGIKMLKQYGVPQLIVMRWMGHSSLEMTNGYLHMTAQDSRHFFEKHVQASG